MTPNDTYSIPPKLTEAELDALLLPLRAAEAGLLAELREQSREALAAFLAQRESEQ